MIFVGGRVYAPDHPGATAVVLDEGLISYVGSDEVARRLAGEQTELIFAAGCLHRPSSMLMRTSSRLARSWRVSACTM